MSNVFYNTIQNKCRWFGKETDFSFLSASIQYFAIRLLNFRRHDV